MKTQRGIAKKVEILVVRTDGTKEIKDITNTTAGNLIAIEHAANINLDKIRKATANAGRGNVIKAMVTYACSNLDVLAHNYNNLYNEGAEGYIPYDRLKKSSEYKAWEEIVEVI